MTEKTNESEEYLNQCRDALSREQSQSLAATDGWKHVDKEQVHKDWDTLYKELAPLIDRSRPDDVQVQGLVDRHYSIARRFYVPSKEAYIGMSLFYHSNKDMRDFHNGYHPDMVEFLGSAMKSYAEENL